MLLLKHTGTQLFQGVSCLSISTLILLETTLQILPTWSLWSQNKYLEQFLGASSSFPNADSGHLPDHLSLLELLIEELYCKLCEGAKNYQHFILFTASFYQCKFPMDTIYLHLNLLKQINNMVWNRASICTFPYAQHPEVWHMIPLNIDSHIKPQINQNTAYMNSY